MTSDNFNYGKKLPNGQYENHPCDIKSNQVNPIRYVYMHVVCGGETVINSSCIAETYATNPSFYGATFCAKCRDYFPLLIDDKRQFKWVVDDVPVGE